MKNSIFSALVLLACLLACNSKDKENEMLHSEVIAIHDEVMPVMGKVKSLQTNILKNVDELYMEDSITHREKIQTMMATASALDSAYENMFVWMRQFNSDYKSMAAEEANIYLRQQKELVGKVNADIKEAITKGEAIIP